MKKEDLEKKIIVLIVLYDYLISINGKEAYHFIRKKYQQLLDNLNKYETIQSIPMKEFDGLLNVFRLFQEAPCRDVNLSKYILYKMQEIYLIQENIFKS